MTVTTINIGAKLNVRDATRTEAHAVRTGNVERRRLRENNACRQLGTRTITVPSADGSRETVLRSGTGGGDVRRRRRRRGRRWGRP